VQCGNRRAAAFRELADGDLTRLRWNPSLLVELTSSMLEVFILPACSLMNVAGMAHAGIEARTSIGKTLLTI
jgi:hypothetical protein